MSEEEKLVNVLDKTVVLLRSAQPVVEHGCEVCEYMISREVYLATLHALADFRGVSLHDMSNSIQVDEVPNDC